MASLVGWRRENVILDVGPTGFVLYRCRVTTNVARVLMRVIVLVPNFSDKFGHRNCVILRESAKPLGKQDVFNALIVASFGRNRANLRNIESGFESR